MVRIIAREKELEILHSMLHSKKPEFLAVYGRRRVGKTFLIREFFCDKGIYFHITGVKGASTAKQLRSFTDEFKRVFGGTIKTPKNWQEAFFLLRDAINTMAGLQRIILFFDELPWLTGHSSGFLQDLDHLWNRHLSSNHRILLIVCGSSATWMIRKITQNKGGLHGRLTATIQLKPFNLLETEKFLKNQGVNFDRKQVIDIYMALGGIPKYLSYVERGLSSLQIINKICFSGPLVNEFNELYSSLFENHERYVAIIRALASKTHGLTKTEISAATGITSGGGLKTMLEALEQSDFIMAIPDLGKIKKNLRYRLVDEYSLFYIDWIEPAKTANLGGADPYFWITRGNSPEVRAWSGYAFESLCMRHINSLKQALGIFGVATHASGWSYKPKENSEKGAQIDLVIDRADHCINLCEIKFSSDTFTINKNYESELRRRKALFIEKTSSRKTIFLTFITPYGINKESGYFGIADKELTMDDLFLPCPSG